MKPVSAIAALKGHVATLRGIIAKAEALAEQQRQEVATATRNREEATPFRRR